MAFKLELFNPSNYPRGGVVAVPWQPIAQATGVSPERLLLFDEHGRSLPLQVDRPDNSDPSHDKLCFLLQDLIPPGPEDYSSPSAVLRAEDGDRRAEDRGLRVAALGDPPKRVELRNGSEKLTVSLSLLGERELEKGKWYAGAADSVRLDGIEILDEFAARFHSGPSEEQWKNHDPEKRCMQIDKIRFWNAPWEEESFHEITIYDKFYGMASECVGPVRGSVMIVCPFYYSCNDSSSGRRVQMECRLHRIISLNAGADYVLEEIYVKGGPSQMRGGRGNQPSPLSFSAHYFTNMDVGYNPVVYRYEHIPDWFAVGCPEGNRFDPHPGYGFATDVHTSSFSAPVPDYPNRERAHRTFCWSLPPDKNVHCLHAFIRGTPAGFGARIGELWYEQVFKPLNKVRIVGMSRPKAA
jgi:hypothetical protein